MSYVHRPLLPVCLVILLISALALAEDQETKINKKDLPAPVLTAFQRDYPRAKITGASHETENGAEYFEITSKQGGVKRDVLYQPDGVVVSVEETIRRSEVPTLVNSAVMKQYPKGKIKSAERISRAGVTSFELVVRDGKRHLELAVAADGRITETEEKTGKDED